MKYVVAVVFPPLALLMIGKPGQGFFNCFMLLLSIPLYLACGLGSLVHIGCIVHACMAVSGEQNDRRFAMMVGALNPNAASANSPKSGGSSVLLVGGGMLLVLLATCAVTGSMLPKPTATVNPESLIEGRGPEQEREAGRVPAVVQPPVPPAYAVVEERNEPHLPGLKMSDVLAAYNRMGYECNGPRLIDVEGLPPAWLLTCTHQSGATTVHVTLSGPERDKVDVASIMVSGVNLAPYDVYEKLSGFMKRIAYEGADLAANAKWPRDHIDGGRSVVGVAAFEMLGTTKHGRVLRVLPSQHPEVLAWNDSNMPKVVPFGRDVDKESPEVTAEEKRVASTAISNPAAKASVSSREPAVAAESALKLAKKLQLKNPEAANRRFEEIVEKYPGTPAADEAAKLLEAAPAAP